MGMDIDRLKKSRKAAPGGRPRLRNLPRNWLHQGVTYMDRGEAVFRVALETLEILLLAGLLLVWRGKFVDVGVPLAIAAVAAHTFNWVTNGNFWALILFAFPMLRNRGDAATCSYLNAMAERLRRRRSISALALFGSVARGEWHERSDVDVRLLRFGGFGCWLGANLLLVGERFRAFLSRQPIDVYLGDDADFFEKMRKDEPPIFLIKRDPRLERRYTEHREGRLGALRRTQG